jgi:undecaprenol kinase
MLPAFTFKICIISLMGLKHSTMKSISYAGEGLNTALKQEPNFRIHIAVSIIVLFLAIMLGFDAFEWLLLFFTISLVIILELINTALESLVDIVSPDIKDKAKTAKDVSAASVFVAAFVSVIVGIILFVPKILALLGY